MALLDICIGVEQFREIRENNYCYVDKTSFIEEMLKTIPAKVSLITRPRRFGKTLTMTMLREFFYIRQNSYSIFEGLAVSRDEELCQTWMNQYPTILLTFKGIEGKNYDFACCQISKMLQEICIEHAYLLESEKIAPADKKSLLLLNDGEASEGDIDQLFS